MSGYFLCFMYGYSEASDKFTFDQPLFALAKLVQWQFPATHGEGQYVAMLRGLHTEMALWNVPGDLLEGSGWTSAL